MSEEQNKTQIGTSQFADGDKNQQKILCERCSSVILLPEKAEFKKTELFLPHMKKKSDTSNPYDGEMLMDFWMVDDMFTFENVGFSNTVDGIKYLICADCEIGPVGYHNIQNKHAFYISHSRIKYES